MRLRRGKPKSIGAAILALLLAAAGAYFFPQQNQKQKPQAERHDSQSSGAASSIKTPRFEPSQSPPAVEKVPPAKPDATPTITGDGGIGKLFREQKSNVIVTTGGTIAKVLPDDNVTSDGSSRHQRWIVRLTTGDTVLIAHNIDLADRVPVKEGDVIKFKGEYEFTQQGGVVHWTHHDPRGRRQDGWIEFNGKQYK
ncbi:MAG TPA: DUF3465 domain-containing protein [Tepidisphaeraceae bacterium]|nr:DUF3465 domain-containing protein [Tepidisphaeraceae bacterium]